MARRRPHQLSGGEWVVTSDEWDKEMTTITVIKPGLQSTLQDAGRRVRALGVPAGGAADPLARRLANALVGNPPGAAGLEVTLSGPTLRFHEGALISLCGAPFQAALDGTPLPLWRAVSVQAGQTLSIGGTARGMRAFLAVRGGLQGQPAFGSLSTDLRSQFGGLPGHDRQGRALQAGDELHWSPLPHTTPSRARLHPDLHTPCGPHHPLRVLTTPDTTPALLKHLTGRTFTVSAQVDRMGARLTQSVPAPHDPSRVSTPNVPGMMQLPPDGRPILLLPDAGTHGGYATPLIVASVDFPRLAQLRPGDSVSFHVVSAEQARTALRQQEQDVRQAENALRWWYAQT